MSYAAFVKYKSMKRKSRVIFSLTIIVFVLISCSGKDKVQAVKAWPSPAGDVVGKVTVDGRENWKYE